MAVSRDKKGFLDFNEWNLLFYSISSLRDKVIFAILYSTGCSEKELVNLRVQDISPEHNTIDFFGGKNRKTLTRRCYVNDEIMKMLSDYIHMLKDKKGYLFQTRQSNRLSEKRIQQIVTSNSRHILGEKISPKYLRYTHVVHALQKRISVFSICRQTGLKTQRIMQIAQNCQINIFQRYRL